MEMTLPRPPQDVALRLLTIAEAMKLAKIAEPSSWERHCEMVTLWILAMPPVIAIAPPWPVEV
jgi:hypothetical protein